MLTRNALTHWFVTGTPKEAREEKAISPLFPQVYGKKEPDRRILSYTDIRDHRDQYLELTFYGVIEREGSEPDFIEATEPEFTIKDQTLYLPYEDGELMVHPRQQINGSTPFVNRWYLKFYQQHYVIFIDNLLANTVAVGNHGERNSLFEKTVGEYECYTNGNISLASSDWTYTLELDYLIRATKELHVAICGDKAFILDKPLVDGRHHISSETTHRGKVKIHVHND